MREFALPILSRGPAVPSFFHLYDLDELSNWRPERNKFSRIYFNMYHSHIPKFFPEEDYDDRNALYSMSVPHPELQLQLMKANTQ
ncbi:hypothetical protein DL98DRAFT_106360 [Cadophora sp. DSE1049]|nr:hypothetical protein DL98DRAFT_106360 [Cadophora sp. DSE1049]